MTTSITSGWARLLAASVGRTRWVGPAAVVPKRLLPLLAELVGRVGLGRAGAAALHRHDDHLVARLVDVARRREAERDRRELDLAHRLDAFDDLGPVGAARPS